MSGGLVQTYSDSPLRPSSGQRTESAAAGASAAPSQSTGGAPPSVYTQPAAASPYTPTHTQPPPTTMRTQAESLRIGTQSPSAYAPPPTVQEAQARRSVDVYRPAAAAATSAAGTTPRTPSAYTPTNLGPGADNGNPYGVPPSAAAAGGYGTPGRQSIDLYGGAQPGQASFDQNAFPNQNQNLVSPAGYRQNPIASSHYNSGNGSGFFGGGSGGGGGGSANSAANGGVGAIDRFNNVLSGDKSAKEYATEVYGSASKTASKLYGSASGAAGTAYSSTSEKVGEWSSGVSRWWNSR